MWRVEVIPHPSGRGGGYTLEALPTHPRVNTHPHFSVANLAARMFGLCEAGEPARTLGQRASSQRSPPPPPPRASIL